MRNSLGVTGRWTDGQRRRQGGGVWGVKTHPQLRSSAVSHISLHFRVLKIIATSGFLTALRVHQIRFQPGLRPGPRWGSLQRSPDPLAGLRVPTSKGRGGKGTKKEGRRGKGQVGERIRELGEWKGCGCQGKGSGGGRRERKGREGKERVGRKVSTPPPSIPAYAPADGRRAGRTTGRRNTFAASISSITQTCEENSRFLIHFKYRTVDDVTQTV